jgi:hypothetical protein
MSRNFLDLETSPYLLQHRFNPVHWRAWGPDALAEAKSSNKPILLSVGYAACHWCHVMAHESFEDEATARLMNELYIPIKVDREERPDIDIIYQSALASLGQQGGWPLTMFLTPAGEPFWGGTYFPPKPRFGRPSFGDVLESVAAAYDKEPEKIAGNVLAIKDALSHLAQPDKGPHPDPVLEKQIVQSLYGHLDLVEGGLSGAPKFPQISLFLLLWRVGLQRADPKLVNAVTLTLDKMSLGGLYDHLGGGYSRYSTDSRWLAPHFEKMLYDNAQLIELLTTVWQQNPKPLYAACVADTVAWLQRDMLTEHQAFAATLDADSEGVEGKYYVWREEEIDQALPSDQAGLFKTIYDVTAAGNWEGRTILNRNHPLGDISLKTKAPLAQARATLLAIRQNRIPPARDDKVLADWNGMMIAALSRAAFVFARPDWLALAEQAFAAILHDQSHGDRLLHSWRNGKAQAQAMLDDYAQMARAALILFEMTSQDRYLTQAKSWVATLDRFYWDDEAGGYFFTASDASDLILRTKTAFDHATPSGNAVMIEVLARLYYQTGVASYRDRAEALTSTFAGQLEQSFPSMAALLNAWNLLTNAVQIVLVGNPEQQAYADLLSVIAGTCVPNLILTRLSPTQSLNPDHPAYDKVTAAKGAPTAYVCVGPVCSPPLTQPTALRQSLERIN